MIRLTQVALSLFLLAAPPTPTLTAVPPLTFTQMNELYGPCVHMPVLMYHHIEDATIAQKAGYTSLTVFPSNFENHLAYLNNRKYSTVTPAQLIAFFDRGVPLPGKPIMLTFDDGYADFVATALPILTRYSLSSILFLPTGLANNPGYLNWDQVLSLPSQNVYVGNHSWSHTTKASDISPAHLQLQEHHQNPNSVFAYPYGTVSQSSFSALSQLGYSLAFTTKSGTTQCAKLRFQLPRLRAGNSPLSTLGL